MDAAGRVSLGTSGCCAVSQAGNRIDSRENRVRIPTLKHIDVSRWYSTKNEKYGGLSPRDYLRDKDWEEQMRIGLDILREYRVLQ